MIREQTFDRFFGALNRGYPYFDLLEADWDTVVDEARRTAIDCRTREEFFSVVSGALAALEDPHVALLLPFERDCQLGTHWTIAPIEVTVVDRRLFVSNGLTGCSPQDLSAEEAVASPELLSIDGSPARLGLLQSQLAGPPETSARLELSWPEGTIRELSVDRLPIGENSGRRASYGLPLTHNR